MKCYHRQKNHVLEWRTRTCKVRKTKNRMCTEKNISSDIYSTLESSKADSDNNLCYL